MSERNKLKARLAAGACVPAIWAELGSPDAAEAAVCAGWPAVLIDNEHGVADLRQASHLLRAVEAAGGDAILRVPAMDETYLKLALDRGFRTIMAPMINTVAEAEAFVAACRYPPRGRRGYAAPIARASGYGARADYAKTAHTELLLLAQIETPQAAANAAEIAAVDGVDMLFVGPNDMAGFMGFPEQMDHPEVVAALDALEAAIRARGAWMGSVLRPGVDVAELRARGYRLIVGPSDIGLMIQAARDEAAMYRQITGYAD